MDDFEFESDAGIIPKQKSKESLKNVLSRKELDDHELFMLMNEYD